MENLTEQFHLANILKVNVYAYKDHINHPAKPSEVY